LRAITGYLDEAIAKTRSLTFDVSPTVLRELGLPAALNRLMEIMSARGEGTTITVTVPYVPGMA